jgi:hypothetical protein
MRARSGGGVVEPRSYGRSWIRTRDLFLIREDSWLRGSIEVGPQQPELTSGMRVAEQHGHVALDPLRHPCVY